MTMLCGKLYWRVPCRIVCWFFKIPSPDIGRTLNITLLLVICWDLAHVDIRDRNAGTSSYSAALNDVRCNGISFHGHEASSWLLLLLITHHSSHLLLLGPYLFIYLLLLCSEYLVPVRYACQNFHTVNHQPTGFTITFHRRSDYRYTNLVGRYTLFR